MKNRLKVHYFQHIAGEGFGSCYEYLQQKNAQISATEFFALPLDRDLDLEALPLIEDVDLLIIMGGAMSVNDEVNYPWLKIEKRWLRRYLALGKPVIGLCLGGQLIAQTLGAAVSRHVVQELGWNRVYKVMSVAEDCFQLPEQMQVMQWHSESFELPKGAIHLAYSEACRHQMYQLGKNVLAFQFHPEMTAQTLALYLENEHETSLFSGPYVQDISTLKNSKKELFVEGNQILKQAIDYVLAKSSFDA